MCIVYHIRDGTANTISYLRQSIEEKFSMGKSGMRLGRFYGSCTDGIEVKLLEAEACPDHIHMLVEVPPKLSISNFMGFLKGKSSLMIFDRFAQMKYRFGDREFWCRGYFVDTVGKNKNKIAEYIRNQLEEDRYADQLVMNELVDPFTGEPMRKKGRK